MTSGTVTEVANSFLNVTVKNVSNADTSGPGFSKVLTEVSDKTDTVQTDRQQKKSSKKTDTNDQGTDAEVVRRQDDQSQKTEQTAAEKKPDETTETKAQVTKGQEAEEGQEVEEDQEKKMDEETIDPALLSTLNGLAADVIQNIAEKLGVSKEDVMNAMQSLGLQMTDVLNADNLTDITMAITGEDMVALVTDEKLYQNLQELTELVNGNGAKLMEELGITQEELKALLEKAGSQNQESLQTGTTGEKTPVMNTQPQNEMIAPAVQEEAKQTQDGSDEAATVENGTLEKTVLKTGETADRNADQGEPGDETAGRQDPLNGQTQTFAAAITANTNEFVEALAQEDTVMQNRNFGETLMKQITDYMKIQVRGDLSSVEMQLHPASLGTLSISLASKNGLLTAQFTTQNEAVKEVLEGQVVQLRENLENQGVKVEAVEVTVSSHEFERNLEQNAEQEANQSQESEAKKRGIRKIDLMNMDDAEEEMMDEAELLTRDMMSKNGNSVDFMA